MKLIPNWKRAYKMVSVQCQTVSIAVLGGWQALGDDLQAAIPLWVVFTVAITLLVIGTIGRLVQQKGVSDGVDNQAKGR